MLSPKRELQRTRRVGPIGLSGTLYLALFPKGEFHRTHSPPTTHSKNPFLLVVGFLGGRIYLWNFSGIENWVMKIFYPPKGLCKADTEGGLIVLLMSYFGLGNVYWTFNLHAVFCLFETPRMFYPPYGGCGSSTQGVQFILFPFYWCWKRYWHFQNHHF